METNIVLKSKDRNLFGVVIKQETKTGYLSVSELQKAYEVARWQYGWSDKRISDIMQTDSFKERTYYLLQNQGVIKASFPVFMEMVEKEGVTKVLKGLGAYKTTGARENKATYTNPYIWILLAMELNPMIYATVVTWLTDSLIFDRVEAGNEFKPMNEAIKKIVANPNYSKYSIAINERVFGRHLTGMRNLASAQELRKITKIEQFISQGINIGMITKEDQILYTINKMTI
jgi:hypothetical protein